MPVKSPKPPIKLYCLLSLFIAFLDLTFVGITFNQSKQALISSFEKEASNQHATFRNSFNETINNMLQIATFVANDPRIQQAFLKGKRAVESEGGGAGKHKSSVARKNLLKIVAPSWAEMTKQFKARQLHFHLGPGSVSFLRVHKPKKFGDNMDDVRYTIVDANRKLQSISGFETGRVYSGIRGVQPIFALAPESNNKIHVGAVESGISYHNLLKNLSQTFNINIVILLTTEHIQANVWPDFLNKRLKSSPPFGEFVIEESTSKEFKNILDTTNILEDYSSKKITAVSWKNRFFVYSEIPLRDYRGKLDSTLKDAGKIVFWKDTTDSYNAFFENVKTNIFYAVTAFLLVEFLLYFGLRKTTTISMLNQIISQRTQQLNHSNQQLLQEITLKEAKELELKKLTLAVEQNPCVIIITDKSGIIEYVNHKFVELTGYTVEEAIGQTTQLLSSGQTPNIFYANIKKCLLSGKEWRGEFHNRKKNGEFYWAQEYMAPIFDEKGQISHFVAIQEDITEQRLMIDNMNYQVSHDPLTGLINRREFEKRLGKVICSVQDNQTEHIFCFFDLDQFKIINDTSGHPAGDELLRQVASLIAEHIRKRDTLARLGGDEFGILMESCSVKQGERIAEKIREVVEHFVFVWENKSFSIGVSIGIVSINHQTEDMTEAFKQADVACYAAKAAGRNRVRIYKKSDLSFSNSKNELAWANGSLIAIKEGRLALFAQVITPIGIKINKKLRFEILVRQYATDGSMISPAQFLPALERYNLAVKLDSWVIANSFLFIGEHINKIANVEYFAINLSGQSLCDKKIHELIVQQLHSTANIAKKIVFEITETVAIANITEAIQFITSLKYYGFRFALDDFGSGMSSFAYLKKLPVDFLKIDGLFVKNIVEDPIDFAMVKSINEVGQLMGLGTIAEFVENDEILQKLKTINVDCAQGYYLGKPQPLESFFNTSNQNKMEIASPLNLDSINFS